MTPPGAGTEERPHPSVLRFARQCYPTAQHFQRAVIKGHYARLAGRTLDENPYRGRLHGKRRRYGRGQGASENGTFTFAWRNAWEQGWRHAG